MATEAQQTAADEVFIAKDPKDQESRDTAVGFFAIVGWLIPVIGAWMAWGWVGGIIAAIVASALWPLCLLVGALAFWLAIIAAVVVGAMLLFGL